MSALPPGIPGFPQTANQWRSYVKRFRLYDKTTVEGLIADLEQREQQLIESKRAYEALTDAVVRLTRELEHAKHRTGMAELV